MPKKSRKYLLKTDFTISFLEKITTFLRGNLGISSEFSRKGYACKMQRKVRG